MTDSMLTQISNDIKDAHTVKDLQPFVQHLLNEDELKTLLLRQIENKFDSDPKVQDKDNCNDDARDAGISKIYFNTRSLTEIFPDEIIVKMIEYLDTKYFEIFVVLSKTFQSIIYRSQSHRLFASV